MLGVVPVDSLQQFGIIMKNRKIVQFVLYPRLFQSFCILYKGTYCVSFKLYHISPTNKVTHAFPFLLPQPGQEPSTDRYYQQASVHTSSNFSFDTESFYMVYEEDNKSLKTQCVFRLEYEYGKEYKTYLSCKLLKRHKQEKKKDSNLCTRQTTESKYQTVSSYTMKVNHIERVNQHQRVYFHSSEFFSAIDFRFCTFYHGIKLFKDKKQLSHLLEGYDLSKCDPISILQLKKDRKEGKEEKPSQEELFKDLANDIIFAYNQLLNMVAEYGHWHYEIILFRDNVLSEYDRQGRQLAPFKMHSLVHLNRGHFLEQAQIRRAYGINRQGQTLAAILQQKQLVRINIRALRQYYCMLMFHQPEHRFKLLILKSEEEMEKTREHNFVSFRPTQRELIGGELRSRASQDFSNSALFCPEKMARIPYLLVEGYDKPARRDAVKHTLTVFVHGYQGNSFDFQKSRNFLKKYNKATTVLIVESITPEMDKSIEDLGTKVAQQVTKYVENSMVHYEFINFIGFSLGGLIVRACLEGLGNLRKKLGIFVTFSSPHLGISQSQNSLVNLGVWYLIKVDKVKNLKELNFQSVKLHDSLLMRLSKCPHISNFSKVILVSSKDDGFVPLYSTFLERDLCHNQILSLCNNIRSKIRRLERVQVVFNTEHAGTLDKLTGRRGHIEFLDNHFFLEQFFRLYAPFF